AGVSVGIWCRVGRVAVGGGSGGADTVGPVGVGRVGSGVGSGDVQWRSGAVGCRTDSGHSRWVDSGVSASERNHFGVLVDVGWNLNAASMADLEYRPFSGSGSPNGDRILLWRRIFGGSTVLW